ncbi:[protein-PII] uridylyltransferase [Shewanella sp. SR44-3]|uniref:[protein-PII] uridylyltransferase n=1 Tax=Shewanella sp. SR44-3 TaxID=2760936 RepID=UPI0015F98F9D|nr:[protein-PII] uridylyltransferase [Shewanella sp. SR44-3]MBB1268687.1 [protein-PII] uridylyltransferase [Shewanella sp. SR44-3]
MLAHSAGSELNPYMSIAQFKQAITEMDNYLEQNVSHFDINDSLKYRAQFFDTLLCVLWNNLSLCNETISLNAVGGYGRQTLHPYSDIDICLVHDKPLDLVESEKISQFLTQLWDLGIELGHGVRSLDDTYIACKEDVTTATSLLEIRHLAGAGHHEQRVLAALYSQDLWHSEAFFNAKLAEQQQRHAKAQGTAYSIEPNLKTSPGGMRDIQTLTWVARKHFAVADMQQLRKFNFFTNDEYAELLECQNFLWRVRFALHQAAKRNENRLLLQYQADVARLMGFGDSGNIIIEKMMRQLFRAMKRIKELNQMLLAYFAREISPQAQHQQIILNPQFEILDKHIHAVHEDVFIDRTQIMVLFELVAIHHKDIVGITPETLRLLRQVRRRLMGDLQDFHACREKFLRIFKHPQGMGLAISLMHEHGILASYLPQWREVVGQMQFDLFHAYTVDEHTHKLLKKIHQFRQGNLDGSNRLASDIFQKMSVKESLLFAALFHDLAKGRGGDHSELGAVDAAQFAKFHDLKKSQQHLITWLVEHHLLMSITSQRMDIYDLEVVNTFAKTVGTQTRLDALYCLTVADIQATNDDLWNDWKASLLKDLYFATRKALQNGFQNVLQLRSQIREQKQEALGLLIKDMSLETVQALWKRLPLSFFSNTEADDIARYTLAIHQHELAAIQNNEPAGTLILIEDAQLKASTDVFVYTQDRPGLFVKLFNTLAALRISVKQAQISKTKDGSVVESFKVLDFDEKPIASPQRRNQITQKLLQVLDQGASIPKKRTPRHNQTFSSKPNIEFLHTKHNNRSLLHISALETSEFMEQISQAFRSLGLNIHAASINTVGERADNVFLLSNLEGHELSPNEQEKLKSLLVSFITSQV